MALKNILRQKIALDYYTSVATQLLAIISGIVVARIAGPSVLGVLAFGLSFASLFRFISDLGLGIAHVKLISSGEDLAKCNATFSVIKLISTALFLFVIFIILLSQKYIFNFAFESQIHKQVTIIFVLVAAVSSLIGVPTATFTAKTEVIKKNVPRLFQGLGLAVTKIILVLLGFGALAISLSTLFFAVLTAIFALRLFRYYPFSKFDQRLAKKYLKIALPMVGVVFVSTAVFNVDKVILSYLTNLKEVGYYAVGYKIGMFLRLMSVSFGTLLFPVMSGYIKKRNYQRIKNIIVKYEKFIWVFIMPPVIFIAIYSDVIVRVALGNEYFFSIKVLSTLMLAMFMALLIQPYRTLVVSAGFFKESILLNVYYLIIFVTVEYFCVSSRYLNLGARGAAVAMLIANLFLVIIFRAFVAKRISQVKISFDILPFLYGAVNLALFYFAYSYLFAAADGLGRALFPIVYFLLTYLSLYFLRIFKKQDFKILKSLVDVKSMKDYAVSELFGDELGSMR